MIPEFKTQRLVLKMPTLERDEWAYKKHFVNYEVIRHLSHRVPWPYPEDGIKDFLENLIMPELGKTRWLWGIFLKSNPGELIGAVEYFNTDEKENRGFWLSEAHWGSGIMTEAVSCLNDYAFNELGFDKLYLCNALGNIKSRRIKEKNGAKFLYIEPFNFVDPNLNEHEVWELTKKDWFDSRKAK